jgi:D-glycero-D-manno-heptose 1,7-bisphosphate phosphatase
MSRRRFVVLDRDGTIIVDRGYLADPDGVELLDGAAEGLRRLAGLGLGMAVVTNQSAIGRGMLDELGLERIHLAMLRLLNEQGVGLDGVYWCPHIPGDGCACRKPATKLVERAAAELDFDPRRAFVVGDKSSDVELGRRLGATTLLVRTGEGARTEATLDPPADHVVDGLLQAAERIEELLALENGTGNA